MSRCISCGRDNPAAAKFCAECGARLPATCAACGSELLASAKFCSECGRPVGAVTGPAAPSTATPSASASPTTTPSAPATAPVRFGAPSEYVPRHLAERILASRPALEGERKQVTVLFADLKGSMELLADRDPEEARRLLDGVLERMMDAVHRYEGTVNQVMGDGIMALFGAPLAHEDHAVRACYAALRMQESIRRYAEEMQRVAGVPIQIRVGANSGEVIVRSVGSDLRMDYTAVGQTTHLAARLEQTAMPGSILISAQTLHLVEDYVEVKPLGLVRVKGMAEPIDVFEVTGAGTVRTRLQRSAARGLSRFVGRDLELDQLRQALDQAGAGRGQIVAVVGEPGVGKSRLFHEFLHSHRTRGWLVLQGASVSYGRASPYLPVIEMLKAHVKVEERDDVRAVRAKVTGALLALDEALKGVIPPVLGLLDALPDDHPFLALAPPGRRQATLDALRRLILREAQAQPVILVFEDLHWIDSETQALLDALVESVRTARLLIAVNYRPEYQHGWSQKTFYRQLPIAPLTPASADELLRPLLGDDPALRPLVQLLVERTDGNPLFLEESVRTLVETQALVGEPGRYRLARPGAPITVPATVQAILAARIDRLAPEDKQLLQAASVVGKDVPFALLQALCGEPEDVLRERLHRLETSELLYESALFPELEVSFKHALTHEVTYGGMLLERRRTLHARMVEVIEKHHGDRVSEHVERLAHHAFRGEAWGPASCYGWQAADRAAALCADADSVAHYQRALEALARLPATPENVRAAIDLRLALRAPLWRAGRLERLLEIFREAEALGTAHGETERLDVVYSFFLQYHWAKAEYERAIEYGQRCLEAARRRADVGLEVTGQYYLGGCHHAQGRLREAIASYGRIVALLEGPRETERFGLSGLPYSGACALAAQCHLELGESQEAERLLREGDRVANAANHLYSKVPLAIARGLLLLQRGRPADVVVLMEPVVATCRDNNFAGQTMRALTVLGQAVALDGRAADAIPLVQEAVALQEQAGALVDRAWWLRTLADAQRRAGHLDEAEATARTALDFARRSGERGQEAWTHLALCDIAADRGELAAAEGHVETARVQAEDLGMRPLVAHCHARLGRLYRRLGREPESREHFTTATAMFREIGMASWLERAEREMKEIG